MTALLITAISVGLSSLSWMIVRCRACTVTQRLTEKALQECPAAQRASILRASAELAGQLSAERTTRKPIMLFFGRRSERAGERPTTQPFSDPPNREVLFHVVSAVVQRLSFVFIFLHAGGDAVPRAT